MAVLLLYLKVFLPHLWPLVATGGLFGLDELARRYWAPASRKLDLMPQQWRRRVEKIGLVAAVLYAGFAAWHSEHSTRVQAQRKLVTAQGQLRERSNQNQIIAALEKSLSRLRRKVTDFEAQQASSRLDNHIYQGYKDVAIVMGVHYGEKDKILVFDSITSQTPIDFTKILEFQWAKIFCDNKQPYASAAMGAELNLEYSRVVCHVIGRIGTPSH